MKYSNYEIQQLKQRANIMDHIPGIQKYGREYYAPCPFCGASGKRKGLKVTHNQSKDCAKCFQCEGVFSGAIDAEMYYSGSDFITAVEKVAMQCGYSLTPEEQRAKKTLKEKEQSLEGSFVMKQLEASGLTLEDVTARVRVNKGKDWGYVPTFTKGIVGVDGKVNSHADEMLIYYYDLYGNIMKFAPKGGATRDYVRVRWSNPDIHLGKEGKPMKYMTPKGAPCRFYFPEVVRRKFAAKEQITTLIIQEGEKKAEKACKHGIFSIGIQGIYNIGSKDEGLIQDLQYLVQTCDIRNIVLLFDSDWDNLSSNLSNGDTIDMRPMQFARAAIKFKQYVGTLANIGCDVDIYFGHLNKNEQDEKGIDDLLTGSMTGKEHEVAEDFTKTMRAHDGHGVYADIHKITILSDKKILDFWGLSDKIEFFKRHAERIAGLTKFRFGGIRYARDENGDIIQASTAGVDTEFWQVAYTDKGKKEVDFKLLASLDLLKASGFYRYCAPELGEMNYAFLRLENAVAKRVADFAIRDFVYDYALQNCKDTDVIEMLAKGLGSFLSKDRLERLESTTIAEVFEPDMQCRFYRNGQMRITANSVEFGPIMRTVWKDNVIDRNFNRVQIFESFTKQEDGSFEITPTEDGEDCEFFQYLKNTSNFWRGKKATEEDNRCYLRHIANKITAIGYLLTDYKYEKERRAVIAMDAKLSEVGTSNGRSGKSLIGAAISQILSQTFIDGKEVSPDDQFIYSNVTTRTRNIFYDDVKVNFDFTRLYAAITGDLQVNPKMGARFNIAAEKAPKFYITTNHAINDSTDSGNDRKAMMAFSDWYNIKHSPLDDFGHHFFSEWDERQWALFDNLMAECVMIYLRSRAEEWQGKGVGIITPPMFDLDKRTLRQKITESLVQPSAIAY